MCIIRINDPKKLIYRDKFRDDYKEKDNPVLKITLRDGQYRETIANEMKFKTETFNIVYSPGILIKKLELRIQNYKRLSTKTGLWKVHTVFNDYYIYIVRFKSVIFPVLY